MPSAMGIIEIELCLGSLPLMGPFILVILKASNVTLH